MQFRVISFIYIDRFVRVNPCKQPVLIFSASFCQCKSLAHRDQLPSRPWSSLVKKTGNALITTSFHACKLWSIKLVVNIRMAWRTSDARTMGGLVGSHASIQESFGSRNRLRTYQDSVASQVCEPSHDHLNDWLGYWLCKAQTLHLFLHSQCQECATSYRHCT